MPLGPSAADPYRRKLALGSENQDADYSGMGINNTRAEAAAKARMLKDRFNAAQKAFIREKQLGTIKFGSAEDLAGRSGLRGVADEAAAYENAARPAQKVFTPYQNKLNAMNISEQARTITGHPLYSDDELNALGQRASAGQAALSRRDDMRAGELFQLARKIGEPRERYEQIDQQMNSFADEERKRMFDNARLNNDLINAQRNHELKVINNKSTTDYTDQMNEAKLRQIHADIESKVKRGEIERQQADDEHRRADAEHGLMQDKITENRMIMPSRVLSEVAKNNNIAQNVGNTPQDRLTNAIVNKQVADVTNPNSVENAKADVERRTALRERYEVPTTFQMGMEAANNLAGAMSDAKDGVVVGTGMFGTASGIHKSISNAEAAVKKLYDYYNANPEDAKSLAQEMLRNMPQPDPETGEYKFGRSLGASMLNATLGVASMPFDNPNQRGVGNAAARMNGVLRALKILTNRKSESRMLSPTVQTPQTQRFSGNSSYQPVENNQ